MTPSALMQDPRLQTQSVQRLSLTYSHLHILQRSVTHPVFLSLFLSLSRQVPHMLLAGAQDEYVRDGFRPYASAEELRMPLGLPLGLTPGTAADALAYFHSGYLPHPSLASYRCVL